MTKDAGKAAVRCTAIDARGLAAMEAHGKRLDKSSARRIVRDDDPLVFKGLDLAALYEAHMKDVRQNKAAKKTTLHFIVRFPPDLLDGPEIGKFSGTKKERQEEMLSQSVAFINRTHGGDAVYAARVDRDEAGETIVDVFAAPRYEKRTKRTKVDEMGATWASTTKFGRDLTEKHQDEIQTRHPLAKGMLQGPRMIGIALQSEFASFFREINGVPLAPKKQKKTFLEDRVEIEAYKEIQAARDEIKGDRADLKADQDQLSKDQAQLDQDRAAIVIDRAAMLEEMQVSAGRIRYDAEQRAVSMTMAAKDIDRDIRAGLKEEREQLHQDRADLEEDRADLEDREDKMERRINIIKSTHDMFKRAVSAIKNTLGLTIGKDLTDDIQSISDKIDELDALSAENARPETSGPGV